MALAVSSNDPINTRFVQAEKIKCNILDGHRARWLSDTEFIARPAETLEQIDSCYTAPSHDAMH
jgi:hypothetical protein